MLPFLFVFLFCSLLSAPFVLILLFSVLFPCLLRLAVCCFSSRGVCHRHKHAVYCWGISMSLLVCFVSYCAAVFSVLVCFSLSLSLSILLSLCCWFSAEIEMNISWLPLHCLVSVFLFVSQLSLARPGTDATPAVRCELPLESQAESSNRLLFCFLYLSFLYFISLKYR